MSVDFRVEISEQSGRHVIAVTGEVDAATAPHLRDALVDAVDDGQRRIVVDLHAVSFLDSAGLGVLVTGRAAILQARGELSIVCPMERVLDVFRITQLDEVFTLHATLDDALA